MNSLEGWYPPVLTFFESEIYSLACWGLSYPNLPYIQFWSLISSSYYLQHHHQRAQVHFRTKASLFPLQKIRSCVTASSVYPPTNRTGPPIVLVVFPSFRHISCYPLSCAHCPAVDDQSAGATQPAGWRWRYPRWRFANIPSPSLFSFIWDVSSTPLSSRIQIARFF